MQMAVILCGEIRWSERLQADKDGDVYTRFVMAMEVTTEKDVRHCDTTMMCQQGCELFEMKYAVVSKLGVWYGGMVNSNGHWQGTVRSLWNFCICDVVFVEVLMVR
jgi:hypothetical protein